MTPWQTSSDDGDTHLVERALRNLRWNKPAPRWVLAQSAFALGSTSSQALCRRFGLDPDEQIMPMARCGDGLRC